MAAKTPGLSNQGATTQAISLWSPFGFHLNTNQKGRFLWFEKSRVSEPLYQTPLGSTGLACKAPDGSCLVERTYAKLSRPMEMHGRIDIAAPACSTALICGLWACRAVPSSFPWEKARQENVASPEARLCPQPLSLPTPTTTNRVKEKKTRFSVVRTQPRQFGTAFACYSSISKPKPFSGVVSSQVVTPKLGWPLQATDTPCLFLFRCSAKKTPAFMLAANMQPATPRMLAAISGVPACCTKRSHFSDMDCVETELVICANSLPMPRFRRHASGGS